MNRQEEIENFTKECSEDYENYEVDNFQIVSIEYEYLVCKTKTGKIFVIYENVPVHASFVRCRFNGYNRDGVPMLCRLDS